MKVFWQAVMKAAAKLALYAAEHPDQVAAIVNVAKAAAK